MATVQGIQEAQGNNWVLPTAAGTAVGAGLGASWLAPAKYKSFGDLVDAATKEDSFEMPKAAEKAEKEVADNFDTVTKEVDAAKNRVKGLGDVFKDANKEAAPTAEVLSKLGRADITDPAAYTKEFDLAKIVGGLEQEKPTEISEAMKSLYKAGESDGFNEVKGVLGKYGKFSDDGLAFIPSEKGIKAAKELASESNEAAVTLIKGAKDGKITKDAAEQFAKTAQNSEVGKAFDAIKGQLGKARVKGALIWGAVGLAAGFVISKLVGGSKKEAA